MPTEVRSWSHVYLRSHTARRRPTGEASRFHLRLPGGSARCGHTVYPTHWEVPAKVTLGFCFTWVESKRPHLWQCPPRLDPAKPRNEKRFVYSTQALFGASFIVSLFGWLQVLPCQRWWSPIMYNIGHAWYDGACTLCLPDLSSERCSMIQCNHVEWAYVVATNEHGSRVNRMSQHKCISNTR